MFNSIFDAISRFFQQFVFWYVVEPWEQALRVRAGKYVKRISPGFHLRIPYIDSIHVDSSRYRTSLCSPQTLTTADGKVLICTVATGHALEDIYKLYQTLYSASDTIKQTVSSFVAEEVARTNSTDLLPGELSDKLAARLSQEFKQYGLKDVTVRIQDFAYIKAFRLIQDQRFEYGLQTTGIPR